MNDSTSRNGAIGAILIVSCSILPHCRNAQFSSTPHVTPAITTDVKTVRWTAVEVQSKRVSSTQRPRGCYTSAIALRDGTVIASTREHGSYSQPHGVGPLRRISAQCQDFELDKNGAVWCELADFSDSRSDLRGAVVGMTKDAGGTWRFAEVDLWMMGGLVTPAAIDVGGLLAVDERAGQLWQLRFEPNGESLLGTALGTTAPRELTVQQVLVDQRGACVTRISNGQTATEATANDVYCTRDKGHSWFRRNLEPYERIDSGGGVWWRTRSGRLEVSRDSGANWQRTKLPKDVIGYSIAPNEDGVYFASAKDPATIYNLDVDGNMKFRLPLPGSYIASAFNARGGLLAVGTVAHGVLVLEGKKWRVGLPPSDCSVPSKTTTALSVSAEQSIPNPKAMSLSPGTFLHGRTR